MKKNKITLLTKILAIVIICLISFGGIYVQDMNMMKNIVKNYKLSEDLKGYREVVYKVEEQEENTEETTQKDNKEENTTSEENTVEENKEEKAKQDEKKKEEEKIKKYTAAKNTIEKRLENLAVENYTIGFDKKTGEIYIKIAENSKTDDIVTIIKESGKFEIKDSEDGTVLLDNSKIKEARKNIGATEAGTVVYLEIEFNKEGTEILKDISSNKYAKKKEEENKEEENKEENTTSEENTVKEDNEVTDKNEEKTDNTSEENKEENKEKQVTLSLSGEDITTTSFEEPLKQGIMRLNLNRATTDVNQVKQYEKSAEQLAIIINKGPLELKYDISRNRYVETDISIQSINYIILVTLIVLVVLSLIMIIKHKKRGALAVVAFFGFIAIYLLLIRWTNVLISLESIVGIILAIVIDYIISMNLLTIDSNDKVKYNKEYVNCIFRVLPLLIISIVFSLTKWASLNTVGMAFFWGIVLIIAYNRFIAKNIID